jgi:hypothetical protein|tara:strand:+ start:155 stop:613 length:459 start_codon:yes stop_codon:yes gene_type:complete
MQISKNVSYNEAIKSNTATRLGIDNLPDQKQIDNMKLVADKIFQPLREFVGGPIKINSFFRSPDLNRAIGGSSKSQHCLGLAMDLDDTFGHKTNAEMFNWIRKNLDYDQMIWEFGSDDNPAWVHVSYVSPEKNRNRCLKAYKENNKTRYMVI